MSTEVEPPIFSKTFDLLLWLIPATQHFPRLYRQTITKRLLDAALNFQESILKANNVRGQARIDYLSSADAQLDQMRLYLRLGHHLQWLDVGQYEHVSRMVAEIGRLLGGWRKVTKA